MTMHSLFRRRTLLPLTLLFVLASAVIGQEAGNDSVPAIDTPTRIELDLPDNPAQPATMGLKSETADAVQDVSAQTMKMSEWLGPLAPVALSPFFALTLLSGAALYGGEWLGTNHPLIQAAGPLQNPALFWTFLTLTVVTSIPKFSKVSKPFAQAVDKVEAFAGIIVIVALRYLSGGEADPQVAEVADVVIYQAGIFSFTAESLLTIAMVINVLMINSIKFFFELLIWITPVPLLDAMFEVGNKAACAGLMALYASSPLLATIVNLILFGLCAMIFTWARRREVYYRTLMFDVVRNWLKMPAGKTTAITVFPQSAMGPIPAKSKCLLTKSDSGWQLECPRMFRGSLSHPIAAGDLKITKGWFTTKFELGEGTTSIRLVGSQRYHANLDEVADELGGQLQASESTGGWGGLKAELA